jgi:hypothetical protein
MGPTNHLPGTIFSSSLHGILAHLLHARGLELLPPLTVQLTLPRPRPRPHLGRPHPIRASPWHPQHERLTELRRPRLTSLNLQRLDPLLGECGGPTGVSRDGRHDAIASPMHLWEGGTDGEIDRGVWLAPLDSGMEFGSGAMHAKHALYIILLQWVLFSCLPKGHSNCRDDPASNIKNIMKKNLIYKIQR